MRLRFLLFALLATCALAPAHAQTAVRVFGQLPQGLQPLPGAWVYAVATGEGVQTSADGRAVLNAQTGAVVVQKPGWTAALLDLADTTRSVLLTAGDVLPDGRVDLLDVARLIDFFGERPDSTAGGIPRWHPAYDYDASGRIDTADVRLAAQQRGAEGLAPSFLLIDDAEDSDALTELPLGSYWQTLSDATYNGGTSTTTPASLSRVAPVAGGAHGSGGAVKYAYTLGSAFQFRFAMLRALLTASDGVGIDASAFSGLSFWLKGNGVPLVVSLKSGPTSTDFAEYEHRIDAAPATWARYTLDFATDFRQPTFGQPKTIAEVLADLQAIQFKTSSGTTGEQGVIWVDDLQLRYANASTIEGTVAGQVVDGQGAPVPFARVAVESATGSVREVLAGADGRFAAGTAPGAVTVTARRTGYAAATTSGTVTRDATTTLVLTAARTLPALKPVSSGPVRLSGSTLETDFDGDASYTPFFVRGAAFSVAPIGSTGGVSDTRQYDRGAAALDTLGANTLRTYSGIDPYLLDRAAERDLRAIVGYWVPYNADLSNVTTRQGIVDDFRAFVRRYQDHPALLMWTLGNEQNYENGDNAFWYSLAQELAEVAYEEEGATYHPVSANNGGLFNIGDASKLADDASLTYMDLWAVNVYQPNLTTQFFTPYRTQTSKPVVLTEFGIDALDNRTMTEYEDVQANFDVANWNQIVANIGTTVGGTIFEFTDEWWKAGNPFSHDPGGYSTGSHPDGFSNEEWWGLIAVTPDTDGDGLDQWRARAAYFALQSIWSALD